MRTPPVMPPAALLFVLCGAVPAAAATLSASFTATATVVASCTIAPLLATNVQAALAAGATMCRAPAGIGISAPRPTIHVEHDGSAGLTRVVFAF